MDAAVTHWSSSYIGLPYAETNCAELAEKVWREQFGGEPRLPDNPHNLGTQCALMEALLDDFAEPVRTPRDGDLVLMRCRGRLSHVGVFCDLGGAQHGYVLHSLKNAAQVQLHRLRELKRLNLSVEGFYRWRR